MRGVRPEPVGYVAIGCPKATPTSHGSSCSRARSPASACCCATSSTGEGTAFGEAAGAARAELRGALLFFAAAVLLAYLCSPLA